MKELLDEGAIGNIASCGGVTRSSAASPGFATPGNWHIDPVQNMGMFMDDASHAADWFLWMLGRPTSVIAEIDNVVTDFAPDDNGVAVYRFGKKEMGILLNSSTMLAAEATTEIYGDKGVIVQNYGDAPSSSLPRPADAVALKIFRAGASDWETLRLSRRHSPQRTYPRRAASGDRLSARQTRTRSRTHAKAACASK